MPLDRSSRQRYPPAMRRDKPAKAEWLGATYVLPDSLRVDATTGVLIWHELPRDKIVMLDQIEANKPYDFGQSLLTAMANPAEGRPRRPSRVRVPTEELARSIRVATKGGMEVVVAPVPELDAVFDGLQRSIEETLHPTYLMHGEISPDSIATLFASASALYSAAPWQFAVEEQMIRIDIPQLGVDGACLQVIGSHDESLGILLFRSYAASIWMITSYEKAMKRPPQDGAAEDEPIMRSLSFEPEGETPPSILEEIRQFGWPVAGPNAYPRFLALDEENEPKQMNERDVRIMSATAQAFIAFTNLHRSIFAEDDPPLTREGFDCEDGISVTVTAPYVYTPKPGPRKARKRKTGG